MNAFTAGGLPAVIPYGGTCKDHECLHLRADFCFMSSVSQASLLVVLHKTETSPGNPGLAFMIFAERGGFEPPIPFRGILAFQASQFNHSCISPKTAQFTQIFLTATGSAHFATERPGKTRCNPVGRISAAQKDHHLRYGCLGGDIPAADHTCT